MAGIKVENCTGGAEIRFDTPSGSSLVADEDQLEAAAKAPFVSMFCGNFQYRPPGETGGTGKKRRTWVKLENLRVICPFLNEYCVRYIATKNNS